MATKSAEEDIRPEYYDINGADIASRNRWWIITVLSLLSTVIAVVFAICVRMRPDTVIRIGPHGETTVTGRMSTIPVDTALWNTIRRRSRRLLQSTKKRAA